MIIRRMNNHLFVKENIYDTKITHGREKRHRRERGGDREGVNICIGASLTAVYTIKSQLKNEERQRG